MNYETVLEVKHFTDDLFWFKTTKSEAWDRKNFRAGEFTMIGMGGNDLQRAYSIATSPSNDYLEFYSIKVQDGPLTSQLQHIKPGDELEVSHRAIGTLLLRNLKPATGGKLWCISTGTGLAPFMSIGRNAQTFQQYDQVIVTHTCRTNAELQFADELRSHGATVYQTVTREEPVGDVVQGRITDLIRSGQIFKDLGINQTSFNPLIDRIMICGGPSFNVEIREMLEQQGWTHGTMKLPGEFVQERAFVEVI